ncbi:PREDICTED: DNA repair protein RAD51 homolog 2-like isoform X2 [Amphimedon queenslandica]|uniref:RecA family profile 1 domain-containing protein n=1 Tax=Amphimedon queenslandica TaxID=400682 RepID=A0A1X7UMJ1_AMPQE|nr:PREDICTED: DNA repair protein RAD51 homolog 2-like isoform X2 [Amphimedon queenslandica]|eukprot:XP_019853344.1 PREDICTED: DNA repair protein RAD51 homolog 2-like isoform X2 [Amphimedon queenslandica]
MMNALLLEEILEKEDIIKLHKIHIFTGEDFIRSSPLCVMGCLKCTHTQYDNILSVFSHWLAPNHQTALSLYSIYNGTGLLTHLSKIDTALLGGLPAGTITEISGPSGSGKTQFCLMLAVISSLPTRRGGLGKGVSFIDTNCSFSAKRLISIAENWLQSRSISRTLSDSIKQLADKIKIYTELTCTGLEKRINALTSAAATGETADGDIIIIDSLAGLVRKEYDIRTVKGVSDRYQFLSQMSSKLKAYAEEKRIPVIVTSQVSTQFSSSAARGQPSILTSLGISWTHCVDTRLFIEFYKDSNKRKLSIAKSPTGGLISVIVRIEKKGLILDYHETNQLDHQISGDSNSYSMTVKDQTDRYTHRVALRE